MSKKIKVLVVPSDRTGVGYFRSTKPHITLEKNYPDEFHVDIDYEPKLDNDAWLQQYDIIHYHRTLGPYERCAEFVDKCDKLGIITIMDIDDHWSPGQHHPAYAMIKNSGMDKKIHENLKNAKNITTTTPLFAKELLKINSNKSVHILPNAIDPTEKQYTPKPEKSDRLRIGWLGGSSHLKDLEILHGVVGKIKSDKLLDKVQFVVCGFDLRGMVTIIDEKTGQQKQRPIQPKESVWYQYERIFTSDYTSISEDYRDFLLSFKKGEYEGVENEPYRRVWTKPISTYATNYNLFDVSLAPIVEHEFNRVKSQLKVIEAGFHKKAIIAQDYGPYQIDLVNYYDKTVKGQQIPDVNPDGNALLVKTSKNHKDWYKNIKKLILNPSLVEDLSARLYETVKDTYSVDAVTEKRRELYLKLLKEVKKPEIVA
jgi:glycosyltransferase involved in cell wall biosynthesis